MRVSRPMQERFVKVDTEMMAEGKCETSHADEENRDAKYGKAAMNIFLGKISRML